MIYTILTYLVLSIPVIASSAESERYNYPTTHRAYHTKERGAVDINCEPIDYNKPDKIKCKFEQTNISYLFDPDKLQEETAKSLKQFEEEKLTEKKFQYFIEER